MHNIKSFTSNQIYATTRYKGKDIANQSHTNLSPASEKTVNLNKLEGQRHAKKIWLSSKVLQENTTNLQQQPQNFHKPRTKNMDTTPSTRMIIRWTVWEINAVNVVGARETVGGPVVQQSGIQCSNCEEFGHYAKECRKPKRVKDSTYHKEKMLLCKQAEKGVQLQAEQSDWLADTDEEIDE
ncbi:ribonuclease H-like domain-containing protein [Tanacetum coccineum]|uniref:Ribonuclease H-like domain-containing protein n=1 Tax=Tanacetum coccineum TaxID=301880 RepID=A0ABQ4ZPF9_9ASTR